MNDATFVERHALGLFVALVVVTVATAIASFDLSLLTPVSGVLQQAGGVR